MLARVTTFAIDGLDPRRVTVEVDVRAGLPAFTVVGLADQAVREARERVRSAILNSGFEFPLKRVTVNLAPASLRKSGPGFDLAIACAILAAGGQVPPAALQRLAVFGELALGGELRPCRGALAAAEGTLRAGLTGLVVPVERALEAALVEQLEVIGVGTLAEVAAVLRGGERPPPPDRAPLRAPPDTTPDLGDVRGHPDVIGALTVAAAGGHNLLLSGPPGVGKTMLARRMPSILPPLTRSEALEVTRIHSVAGLHDGSGLVGLRPFRAPHHTISASGLVGGGSTPAPGEASLAHHGVLFLDELTEFPRSTLEALRQPLEDGRAAIVRGQRAAIFPTRFMLLAATNPCPCGHAPDPRCRCTESDLARHVRRLSGPLLDRIDLQVAVQRPDAAALTKEGGSSSAAQRTLVLDARARQARRLGDAGMACNAHMDARTLRARVRLDADAELPLTAAYPARLADLRDAPAVLFVAGGRARLEQLVGGDLQDGPRAVAIVGTRRASADALQIARGLGRGLAAAGVCVVSGMALGVDAAAHEGALEGGGATLAVLACGPDVPYPRSKAALQRRIAAAGCVVSEMPPGCPPVRWGFPARNRIIAALGAMTIVVEAAERSGSLITAEVAADLGREVAAVPGAVTSWRAAGANAMLRDGATLIRDARDVLDAVVGQGVSAVPPPALPGPLQTVLDEVAGGRDTLAALTPRPADAAPALAALTELELLGRLARVAGGRYVVVPQ